MKEVKLPSGAVLKITPGSFVESKELYQACLSELKGVPVNTEMQMQALMKDLMATMFSSKPIEVALWACMRRCTYNDKRMEKPDEIFEAEAARGDYIPACMEVAEVNIAPFMKSLFAVFSLHLETVQSALASRQ